MNLELAAHLNSRSTGASTLAGTAAAAARASRSLNTRRIVSRETP